MNKDSRVWRLAAAGSKLARHTLADLRDEFRILIRRCSRDGVIKEVTINGIRILVRAEEEIGRQIYFFGLYEPRESEFVARIVKQTDLCLDVGANIGYWTLLLASLAPRGRVHSFEPVELNYCLLCLNVALNRFPQVVLNPCAMGDREGVADFSVATDSAFSSFLNTGRKPVESTSRVRVTTLDGYCAERGIHRIDFLKIDVEGAEGAVLAGATEIFTDLSRRPRALMLELYDPMLRKYGNSVEMMLDRIAQYGYEAVVPDREGVVPFNKEKADRHYNVFFLQKGYSDVSRHRLEDR